MLTPKQRTYMTDRELLELAAKAAGYPWRFWNDDFGYAVLEEDVSKPEPRLCCPTPWNPLVYDADALRLAAKLKIDIEWQATNPFPEPRVEAYQRNDEGTYFCADEHEDDYRRAIVRAAAEIGKAMEGGQHGSTE